MASDPRIALLVVIAVGFVIWLIGAWIESAPEEKDG